MILSALSVSFILRFTTEKIVQFGVNKKFHDAAELDLFLYLSIIGAPSELQSVS